MIFKTELKKWRTQKKSVKITLLVELEDIPDALYKFEDMPLDIKLENVEISGEIKNIEQLASGSINLIISADPSYKKDLIKNGPRIKKKKKFMSQFLIDADKQKERMNTINVDQRAKIYAILRDIDEYSGQGVESLKMQMKIEFCRETEYDMFSLSDCSKELAGDFIQYLIRFCFENGVDLQDHPREAFDNIEDYIRLCLEKKICCICGKPAEAHHCEGSRVGMGRNRNKVDDSDSYFLPLCRKHHIELHNMSEYEFLERYHIKPVKKSA